MAALAHNVLKMVWRLRRGVGQRGSLANIGLKLVDGALPVAEFAHNSATQAWADQRQF